MPLTIRPDVTETHRGASPARQAYVTDCSVTKARADGDGPDREVRHHLSRMSQKSCRPTQCPSFDWHPRPRPCHSRPYSLVKSVASLRKSVTSLRKSVHPFSGYFHNRSSEHKILHQSFQVLQTSEEEVQTSGQGLQTSNRGLQTSEQGLQDFGATIAGPASKEEPAGPCLASTICGSICRIPRSTVPKLRRQAS